MWFLLLLLLSQTVSEMFLQALRFYAVDLICSKSSLLLLVGIGNDLSIDLALVISLFNVVSIPGGSIKMPDV